MSKLTNRTVAAAKPDKRDLFLWDDELKGFGLRVKSSGVKSFIIQYRNSHNVSRRYTLGRVGVLAPEKARSKANKLLGSVEDGADPARDRKETRTAPTMADLADRYVTDYAKPNKKASGVDQDERNIRVHILPALGERQRVAAIVRQDVMRMHNGLRETPGAANRARAVLSKMMELAEVWGMRPDGSNPCRHVKKFPENKRQRFLSAEEFAQLGTVLSQAEKQAIETPAAIAAIRLLIFTGCRRGEILNLKWDEVDWERQYLRLADSKTGPKVVHLNAPSLEVLNGLERHDDSPYVIPGRDPGDPLTDLKGPWRRTRDRATIAVWSKDKRVKKLVSGHRSRLKRDPTIKELRAAAKREGIALTGGITDVRLHDLRHSYASVAAVSGQSLQMIGALLGHAQIETTARYAHLAADPIKSANEDIGRRIAQAMRGESAEIVELPNRQR